MKKKLWKAKIIFLADKEKLCQLESMRLTVRAETEELAEKIIAREANNTWPCWRYEIQQA